VTHLREGRSRAEISPEVFGALRTAGYEVLGELGRGGMGIVYLARRILLNRPCAVKMILAGADAGPEASLRFLAEAETIARLRHPNIVQIHHFGRAGDLPFIELEYLEGGSLDRALDGTPWPAAKAAELIGVLTRALAEAHGLGIVHRDLKPGNVLLTADGVPKIADFGLAKSLASDSHFTRTGLMVGSPCYMAPEQAESRSNEVGPATDVYSLGAMLYELLTGHPPFKAATVIQTLDQVRSQEPVPPRQMQPALPRDLETICLKCLQ
jgi:serine/threonine-protein kinase